MQTTVSLRTRVFNAGVWVLGGHFTSQALRLGSNLIMTRLLVPEMFGIMAIANVLVLGLALFSDLGLRLNIIQSKRGDDPVFLNTVWVIQIARGTIIWLMALATAVAIHFMGIAQVWAETSVYSDPILPFVIGVISFNAVIFGFESTKFATANRNIALGLITRVELVSQVFGLVIMIAWAMFDRSVWALIAGSLSNSLVKMALTHISLPGLKNKFQFEMAAFWEIFTFGKWVFLTSVLGFLVSNGDRLLLAGFIDSTILGIYAIALLLIDAIKMLFEKVIGAVVFPALSEVVREKPEQLKQVYYKFRRPVDAISLFAMGGLFMSGHLLVDILYDDRYRQAGYMLEILSLSLFMERYAVTERCFLALGKPKLLLPATIVELLVLFTLIPIMSLGYGFEAALWVIAFMSFPAIPIMIYYKKKHGILDIFEEVRMLPLFFIGCVCGYIVIESFLMFGWS